MIKKALTVFMGILMLAGVFLAVANFTASDLGSADIRMKGHWVLVGPYVYCVWGGSACIVDTVWVPIP